MNRAAERRLKGINVSLTDFPLETVSTCSLCDAKAGFVILAERDRFGFSLRNFFCSTCGFVFISPRPTAAGYAEFYRSYYRRLIDALYGTRFDMAAYAREQKRFAERLDRVVLGPLIQPGVHRSLLDIGGSTGIVGSHFAEKYGIQVTVIDPAPDELKLAAEAGHETFLGVLEDFPADRSFDILLLARTLNHLQDVNKALGKIRSLASPNSLIYVDIDNFLALCHWRGQSIAAATQIDHCNSTSPQVAEALFSKYGLVPCLRDYSQPPYVGYVLKLAERIPQLPESFPYVTGYWAELAQFLVRPEQMTVEALLTKARRRLLRLIPRR